MAHSYEGPATLRTGDATLALVDVRLWTSDGDGTYSWDGRGRTNDLRALDVQGRGGTLTLSTGREGEVHVAALEPDTERGGVVLRLHGSSGPAPY